MLTQQPDAQLALLLHERVQNEPNGGKDAHEPSQHGSKLGPQRCSEWRQSPSRIGRQMPSGRPHVYPSPHSRSLAQAGVQNEAPSIETQKRPGSQSAGSPQ